ncbi:MAG TPA: glycerophosphodiester phosphodiesterase family protein [Planctomycetota bacterium]|nr:glycerophosphodiester phosphodiesterase family protein [Planctomycetota bacterium]
MNPKLEAYLSRVRAPQFGTAICGHRGASATAPENTLAAFRGAIEAGCDLIELDVLLTRDQELVVFHDAKLGRTTDRRGRVAQLTLDELKTCDAGCWFADTFKGEKVPHLREALDLIRFRAVPMIELKQRAKRAPALVPKLAEIVRECGYDDKVIVIAWDALTARLVREALPQALLARAAFAFTRLGIRRAPALGFDGLVPWRASVTQRFFAEARAAGLFIAPWTVNRPKDMDFFGRAGTDVVITDVPHVLRDHLDALERERAAGAAGGPVVADAKSG